MKRFARHDESAARMGWVKAPADEFQVARWLGVAAIVLQALILGFVSGASVFPGTVILLAIWAGVTRWRIRLDRILMQLVSAVIAIGFLLYALVSPFEFPMESRFIRTPSAHMVARFLIGMQLLAMMHHRERDRPPIWLAGLGALCLPFAVNIRVPTAIHGPLVLGIVSFVAVAALYSAQARRAVPGGPRKRRWGRTGAMGLALLGAMSLGGGSAIALHRHDRRIEWFLRDYLGYGAVAAQPAFSASGRLSDVMVWKTLDANRVALRVFSDHQPGYLRAKAFDSYRQPQWEHSWRAWSTELSMRLLEPVEPARGLPAVRDTDRVFELDQTAHPPWTSIEIWPEAQLGRYAFSTLGGAFLVVDHDRVSCDAQGNVTLGDHSRSLPYSVIAPQIIPQQSLGVDQRALLTSVDPDLDPFLRDLAAGVFLQCRTPREKIDRVQQWFRENFEYQLGINVPPRADPLVYFLTKRAPAHCEFFATGTALLLRAAGVPCRYVTGYVAVEENAVGGYWIARNKDAHAWVEAYDDESRRWVIVESTPSGGIPAARGDAVPSQYLDSARQWWNMLKRSVRSLGFGGLLTSALNRLWTIPGLVTLMLSAGVFLLWKMPRLKAIRRQPAEYRLKSMHAVLKQVDRCASVHGFSRADDETLMKFAERIRSADGDPRWRAQLAACYELYATLRFRGRTDTAAVHQLRDALARFPHASRRTRPAARTTVPTTNR